MDLAGLVSGILCDLQGYNAQLTNVELVLTAFKDGLNQQGFTKRSVATCGVITHAGTMLYLADMQTAQAEACSVYVTQSEAASRCM